MNSIDLSSREWCDLVFTGKNQSYGAYRMRKDSSKRHNLAMLAIVLMALAAFFLPSLLKKSAPKQKTVMVEVTTLSQLEEPEIKQEEMRRLEPVAPPPPALKSSIKFTAPVIKQDAEVTDADEIKSQSELTESKVAISIADVKGNDEINGQDIAELKEVVLQAPVAEEQEQVFQVVEQMPQFPGGQAELLKYIATHLKYPAMAVENRVEGRVVCQFVVGNDGQVCNVKVVKTLDPYCDKEAVRVILSMPHWIPGKQNGKAVAVQYTVPITFRLQ